MQSFMTWSQGRWHDGTRRGERSEGDGGHTVTTAEGKGAREVTGKGYERMIGIRSGVMGKRSDADTVDEYTDVMKDAAKKTTSALTKTKGPPPSFSIESLSVLAAAAIAREPLESFEERAEADDVPSAGKVESLVRDSDIVFSPQDVDLASETFAWSQAGAGQSYDAVLAPAPPTSQDSQIGHRHVSGNQASKSALDNSSQMHLPLDESHKQTRPLARTDTVHRGIGEEEILEHLDDWSFSLPAKVSGEHGREQASAKSLVGLQTAQGSERDGIEHIAGVQSTNPDHAVVGIKRSDVSASGMDEVVGLGHGALSATFAPVRKSCGNFFNFHSRTAGHNTSEKENITWTRHFISF